MAVRLQFRVNPELHLAIKEYCVKRERETGRKLTIEAFLLAASASYCGYELPEVSCEKATNRK